jgi:hypothetical protein
MKNSNLLFFVVYHIPGMLFRTRPDGWTQRSRVVQIIVETEKSKSGYPLLRDNERVKTKILKINNVKIFLFFSNTYFFSG